MNLSLRITGVREDGYHTLDSLFWPLRVPCDTLEFTPSQNMHLTLSCTQSHIDCVDNTLTKAHAAFVRAGGVVPGVHVHLTKQIPHGAGLGGGSSDAAEVLKWCNVHAHTPFDTAQLARIALEVGADVPFFLYNVPARVRGIGDQIEFCAPNWHDLYYVLVFPNIYISTPWAYKAWDERKNNFFLKENLTKDAVTDKNDFSCTAHIHTQYECANDFELVVFEHYPILAELKESLLEGSAECAVMSGSGSAMIGLFTVIEDAQRIANLMQCKGYKVFLGTL